MRAHLAYLKYVLRHKWFVFQECIALGIPLWISVLHDWDKFLPDEWFPYVHTFYKPDGSKQYNESPEFAKAWRLHQVRNKHHWQFWMLTWDRGTTECLPMPELWRREMLADWHGAGRAINGKKETSAWYAKNRDKMHLHSETRAWLDLVLLGKLERA